MTPRKKGARVIGGEVLDRDGLLMAPALVLDARMDMHVMNEKCFGPVLPIMKISRAEEAVALANAGPRDSRPACGPPTLPRARGWPRRSMSASSE